MSRSSAESVSRRLHRARFDLTHEKRSAYSGDERCKCQHGWKPRSQTLQKSPSPSSSRRGSPPGITFRCAHTGSSLPKPQRRSRIDIFLCDRHAVDHRMTWIMNWLYRALVSEGLPAHRHACGSPVGCDTCTHLGPESRRDQCFTVANVPMSGSIVAAERSVRQLGAKYQAAF